VTCKDIIRPVFTAEQGKLCSHPPLILGLKLALTTAAKDATFAAALRQNSKWLERLSVEEYLNLVPGANPINLGAYRIKGAVVLNSPLYLQSLWKALESKGHVWSQASVEDPATLLRRYGGNFDAVVVAAGADSVSMLNIPDVRLVKGQSILLRNERHGNLSPLQCGVLCGQYVMPSQVSCKGVAVSLICCLFRCNEARPCIG
jgi:glycine/D-amino acid oxidase-like deaminating enzyme